MSILLVDDHPPNLMALEAILESLGERLVRASSGSEAVELAAKEDFALVLLDLQMPELDGLETAALIKKAERSHAVPIIIVTSNEPSRTTVAKGYASGAVDFLYKPLDPDVLRSKVSAFVDLYKHRLLLREPSEPGVRRTASGTMRANDGSGRLSERLVAAAPKGEQADTVEALFRIHTALSEDLDLSNIAQRLVEETTALTAAQAGAFHWSLHGTMRVALSGGMRDELAALGPGSPLMACVFGGVGALRIDDAGRELGARAPGGVRSALAVPVLTRGGQVAGALVLVSEHAFAFDDRDEELVAVAARHGAASLENARLYAEAQDARRRAELAELELRAGEARVRLALDSAGVGTFDYNPTTGALRWDTRSRALFGVPPDAVVSYSVHALLVHPDDRARVDAATRLALDPNGDGNYDVEYRVMSGNQSERWIAARGQRFVEHGRPVRFVGTLLDVTAKKIVEQEHAELLAREQAARAEAESARARAEAASRSKDEFLATVSHELRNPLNAILGWSRVLLEEDEQLPRERHRKGLEVIARNAKAQVQLVEDILEVSRIVSGKLRLSTAPTDVRAVVEAAVDTLRAAAQAKGVLIETRVEHETGTIVADEDRIQQVLWNLLSNAVKFTPRGGSVQVDACRDADEVVLCVRDTGEGIDPTFLPFVFDRFRQADGSTTRLHGGLGLGLAIARHLVELHGGTVRAESEGAGGRGATFTVRLPVHAPPQSDRASSRTTTARHAAFKALDAPLTNVHVLVLDDEEDMRDLISMILEHAGARVTRATTVDGALKAMVADRPDVAVSDLAMPGEDGYAFVRRVRACDDEVLRELPLVAMTAYARAEDRHRVLEAGFQRHVAKPIEPAELVATLVEIAVGARDARPGS